MIRSLSETAILNNLGGIRETEPTLDDRLDEIQGMYDNPMGSLHRVPGKQLAVVDTVSTVWSIRQLRFREGPVVIDKTGPTLGRTREWRGGGFTIPLIDGLEPDDVRVVDATPAPMPSFPDGPFDENSDTSTPPMPDTLRPHVPAEGPNTWDMTLNIEPTSLLIEIDEDSGVVEVEFLVTINPAYGFNGMRMTGWGDVGGASVRQNGAYDSPVTDNEVDWYTFLEGDLGDPATELFVLTIDSAAMPCGTTSFDIEAFATGAFGEDLTVPSGDTVSDILYVVVIKTCAPEISLSSSGATLRANVGASGGISTEVDVINSSEYEATLNWAVERITGDPELVALLSVSPTSGILGKGESTPTTVTVASPDGLAEGTYNAVIVFADTNYTDVEAGYGVTLNVVTPVPAVCPYGAPVPMTLSGTVTRLSEPFDSSSLSGTVTQSGNYCQWVLEGGDKFLAQVRVNRFDSAPSGQEALFAGVIFPCWTFATYVYRYGEFHLQTMSAKSVGTGPVGATGTTAFDYLDLNSGTEPANISVSLP